MKTQFLCLSAGILMTGCVAFPVDDDYARGRPTYAGHTQYYGYGYDPRYDYDEVRFKRARGAQTGPYLYQKPPRLPPGQIPSSHSKPGKPNSQHDRPPAPTRPPVTPPNTNKPQQHKPNSAAVIHTSTRPVVGTPILKNQFGHTRVELQPKNNPKTDDKKKRDEKRNRQDQS